MNNDFAKSMTEEIQQSEFYLFNDYSGPKDDDDDDDENNDDKPEQQGSNDNDPPLDEDVVHSPLPPKTGKPQ